MNESALRQPDRAAVAYDPFAGGEISRVVPTTEPQRELWLASQLGEEASLAYNESVSLRLRGQLDVHRLQRALAQVVAAHDALHASFGPDGETFCVSRDSAFELSLVDISGLAMDLREQAIGEHRRRGVETAFHLQQGPLFRAELLRCASDEHLLLMHAHHIVCDGWSWWVIVRELGALYTQFDEPKLVEGRGDCFADYALNEALHPNGPEFRSDEAYWLSRFQGDIPVLDLPVDRSRPIHRGFASLREDHLLDADLVSGVRRLGARRGASLFATLLGGFATVLSRIAGQEQVVVGIPAAGQSIDGHDQLVGHCVNLLPLKFDLPASASFSQVLDQAQETLLDALEHQRYTFGTLLKKLKAERDPARLPLVSVMFNIDQALDLEKSGFPGLQLEFSTNPRSSENFEISINAVQVAGQIRLECQYNRGLFDAITIRRWLSAYESLLRSAVEQPEQAIAILPLLDAQALAELQALQPAAMPFDRDCRMHEHFEWQCDRAPERAAVRCGLQAWSYRQLEARANRISHLLRARGIQQGALVGLAMDRSLDMLAALLGILKAGAGYVPLDPQFPADRLAYMAGDAGLAALLTQSRHAAKFDLRGRPVLSLDELEEELAQLPSQRIGRDAGAAGAESIAYVIYTSGSTGRPKGVQVPHRAVANFLASMQQAPGIEQDDRLVAVTTLSFDIAVLELMLPLRVGAEVLIAQHDTLTDGHALAAMLQATRATLMQATPATWRLLLEAGWKGNSSFRVLCGGEPLPVDLAVTLLPRCAELWNLYGPTETTVWSTCTQVRPGPAGATPDIHIGRPVANTQIWVLDANGQPCPRGVAGEICIGGEGVTLGYLHRPELTAERYIPDVFAADGSVAAPLLYRTGDRGRWRSDGNLEHLGRLDFQVKVRGYRIELGEIENNLASHPNVVRAVVVAREDRPGDVRLVAYLVARPGHSPADAVLAAHLKGVLPDYMIPQHFVTLQQIPLLPNGKVDRKSLPAPGVRVMEEQRERIAPRNELELRVAAAMEAVLGHPDMGVDDSFFELGGHSLLAARLSARLSREFDVEIPLRLMFEAPTVARLSIAITRLMAQASPDAERSSIPRGDDQSTAPMTLMQRRLWLFDQMDPGSVTYNTPSAHRLRGPMDVQAFNAAFQEMVQRQASLRTIIVPDGESAIQQVLGNIEFSLLPPSDLSRLDEAQRMPALLAELEAMTAQPFELHQSPLFRARLYRLGDDDHVLYFMTHHIIWDGWSFDVFYTEMSALYQAHAQGKPSPLPALETSYGDYAHWHVQQMDAAEQQRQLAFWKQHLDGDLEPLHLPEDMPRPARASGHGGTEWVHVDRATTNALHALGSRSGATLFMTLLAAYYVLLHRLSGQDDLIVGLPYRNRHSDALEKIMGFFVNVLPLRVQLQSSMSFSDLIAQVRDATVEAFGYTDVPFEQLVQELKIPRDASRSPLYQALFSFQDVRARNTCWGELQHEHLLMFQKGMSQDLGMWFLEHEEGLSAAMGYNIDIISDSSAALFNQRFVALLKSLAADPAMAIGKVDWQSAQDLALQNEWNATRFDLPAVPTVHAMLAEQAARSPDAVALLQGGTQLSYAELEARSLRISDALIARGVRAGDRVGVCLERNSDLVASLIAVLRTGAAYVPLDPAYPVDRLDYMANDAALALIISQSDLSDGIQWPREKRLLLDHDADEIASAGQQSVLRGSGIGNADSIAYVIYTSGSTGKPKGVSVPHGAALNFLASMQRVPGLRAEDRLLAVTTTSFDISVLELFLPLSVGASIVLADRESAVNGEELGELIDSHEVTVMQATPSSWRLLLEAGWNGRPGFKALCGGEALPRDLAQQLLVRGVQLWNMYGPTETTVWSSCSQVVAAANGKLDIHIGQPIANTTFWVLDAQGQVCPPGVTGEIFIGGAGVAQGYLNQSALTAERFVPDPFNVVVNRPGSLPARLYRTGDRGRWRCDGKLEHMGRLDYQVKVRGYRIELGEIESVIARQDNVAQSVVLVREDKPGDTRLVAYVVTADGVPADERQLLGALRAALPTYMVPQHVVTMAHIPLLPNGKTDRKALPAPTASAMAASLAVSGQTAAEVRQGEPDPRVSYLIEVWSGLLGMQVMAQDNFFDMGGHSMLAVQMANRVAKDTGYRLRLLSLASLNLEQAAALLPKAMPVEVAEDATATGFLGRLIGNVKRLLGR